MYRIMHIQYLIPIRTQAHFQYGVNVNTVEVAKYFTTYIRTYIRSMQTQASLACISLYPSVHSQYGVYNWAHTGNTVQAAYYFIT